MNSPLVINDEAKSWLTDIASELKGFYRSVGKSMSEIELASEIERRWGDELIRKVCIPHNMQHGACWLIAMAVAKEETPDGAKI